MSQELQDSRKISAISYNKPGHTTRGPSLDSKTEKKYWYNIKSSNGYLITLKTKQDCLNIIYRIIRYY
jgi:hypothetical protein